MTKNSDFKKLVRQRMLVHGESYTRARSILLDQPATPADPSLEAFVAKTLRTFMPEGRITAIPAKRKALVVLLVEILQSFERGRIYDEKEINRHLSQFHADFALLRRELVDYRLLDRDATGRRYWVNDRPRRMTGNAAQEVAGLVG